MVRLPGDDHLGPADPLDAFDSPDGDPFNLEYRALLDMQLDECVRHQARKRSRAVVSDALELGADNRSIDAFDVKGLLERHPVRTVSMCEPHITGAPSPGMVATTFPIPSMVISRPRSFIQVTTRSRPALSSSVNASRAHPSVPSIAPIAASSASLCDSRSMLIRRSLELAFWVIGTSCLVVGEIRVELVAACWRDYTMTRLVNSL